MPPNTLQGTGLVLLAFDQGRAQALMVRSVDGWGFPAMPGVTEAAALTDTLQRNLHLDQLHLLPDDLHIDLPAGDHVWRFFIARAQSQRHFLNGVTPDWLDVRWVSFDEAFHIIKGPQDSVRHWAERHFRKLRAAEPVVPPPEPDTLTATTVEPSAAS